MALNVFEKIGKCTLNTGNILSLNDIIRKSGQNPTEEFTEAINITIKEFENNGQNIPHEGGNLVVYRSNDDLAAKLGEQDLSDLKIGFKIFLNNFNKHLINEAIDQAFDILKVSQVHNVIIAYNQKISEGEDVDNLKRLWNVLEKLVEHHKIQQIGLADVEETVFRQIYEWAAVKPKIVQVNLATCCVVPPTLQSFCKDNEVQLLTHSDPAEFLPAKTLHDIFGEKLHLQWILRFIIHIKCRGVLITKGYLLRLSDK